MRFYQKVILAISIDSFCTIIRIKYHPNINTSLTAPKGGLFFRNAPCSFHRSDKTELKLKFKANPFLSRLDIKVTVMPQKPTIIVGEDVRVKVVLDNTYNKDLEVNLTLGGVVVRYDGGIKVTLRKHTEKLALTANDSK